MRVVQILPSVTLGDAVSNDARAIARVIAELGYSTGIYAENIGTNIKDRLLHPISSLPELTDEDVVIFNHSTGTDLCYRLGDIGGRKLMIYHNITPPHFFRGYSTQLECVAESGLLGTRRVMSEISHVMAVSKYNAASLRELGYTCPMSVRPILIPFSDYECEPNAGVLRRLTGGGYVNLLFVGRLAPNKRQEDIIRAFAHYKKHFNARSRLILVGSDRGLESYGERLKSYVSALRLDDVIFAGHTDLPTLVAYYRAADIFLCMSEHEGFGVPLVEAMYFGIPIIAYDSSAVGETLGGSGVLLDSKEPELTARIIDRLTGDEALRRAVLAKQKERLADLSYEKIKARFTTQLEAFISGSQMSDEI